MPPFPAGGLFTPEQKGNIPEEAHTFFCCRVINLVVQPLLSQVAQVVFICIPATHREKKGEERAGAN
jgi:hypothetical protein